MMPLISFSRPHHTQATQNIYSHPPRPHFQLFEKKIGIANYLVYNIIGMELHFALFIKIWNFAIFLGLQNYWDGIFCIQGYDENALFKNYYFCVH
jgi:hypothetical protein